MVPPPGGGMDSLTPTYGYDPATRAPEDSTGQRIDPYRPSMAPVSTRHEYTYVATTLLEDLPLTDLPLRDVEFSWALNHPGTFSAHLQVPVFSRAQDYLHATRPGRTAIYVFRDGVPIWGGIIWKRSMSSEDRVIKLEGDTFDSYAYHRVLDQTLRFERVIEEGIMGTDQINMFRILWAHMSGDWAGVKQAMRDVAVPFRKNADIRVVMPPTPNVTVFRGKQFNHWDFPTYGQLMENLAGLKNGFQWYAGVQPAPETNSSISGVQRRIEFGFPMVGRPFAETGFIWEYPANMLSYMWTDDADKAATRAFILGEGEGELKSTATELNQQRIDEGWPMLDVAYSHTTVVRKDTLLAHAAKYLRAFDPPVGSFDLTVHPDLPPTFGPPNAQHYFLGDEIAIKVDDEIWAMADVRVEDLLVVVKGIHVKPNDEGMEDVKPEVEIKARNTYIGPEDEDDSDSASEPGNGLPVYVGGSTTAGAQALVRSGNRVTRRDRLGGWGGSRP